MSHLCFGVGIVMRRHICRSSYLSQAGQWGGGGGPVRVRLLDVLALDLQDELGQEALLEAGPLAQGT